MLTPLQKVLLFGIGYLIGLIICLVAYPKAHAGEQEDIVKIVQYTAQRYQIDPLLCLAIIKVESKGNPKAVGSLGEVGLMQLRPEFHPGASFDIRTNILIGTRYLSQIRHNCPNKVDLEWITCYNKGTAKKLRNPTRHPYYKKVMKEYGLLLNGLGQKDESIRDRSWNRPKLTTRLSIL